MAASDIRWNPISGATSSVAGDIFKAGEVFSQAFNKASDIGKQIHQEKKDKATAATIGLLNSARSYDDINSALANLNEAGVDVDMDKVFSTVKDREKYFKDEEEKAANQAFYNTLGGQLGLDPASYRNVDQFNAALNMYKAQQDAAAKASKTTDAERKIQAFANLTAGYQAAKANNPKLTQEQYITDISNNPNYVAEAVFGTDWLEGVKPKPKEASYKGSEALTKSLSYWEDDSVDTAEWVNEQLAKYRKENPGVSEEQAQLKAAKLMDRLSVLDANRSIFADKKDFLDNWKDEFRSGLGLSYSK